MPTHPVYRLLAAVAVLAGTTAASADVLTKCEAGQTSAVSKYQACWSKAERAYVLGDAAALDDLTDCSLTFSTSWDKLRQAAQDQGLSCLASNSDAEIVAFLDSCNHVVALTLAGEPPTLDPLTCESELGE